MGSGAGEPTEGLVEAGRAPTGHGSAAPLRSGAVTDVARRGPVWPGRLLVAGGPTLLAAVVASSFARLRFPPAAAAAAETARARAASIKEPHFSSFCSRENAESASIDSAARRGAVGRGGRSDGDE